MKDKRLRLTYITIFLWLAFAVIGICFKHYGINLEITLTNLAIYFVGLSTFIGSYLFSESYRSSDDKTPLFTKGPSSKREILINVTVLLWFVLGVIGLYRKMDMNDLTAYFNVLTPFISGYIIAEGLKKNAISNISKIPVETISENINKLTDDIKAGNTQEIINDIKTDINIINDAMNNETTK